MPAVPIFPIIFLIFMTLKLLDKIDWSWWWVTAPLWGPFTAIVVIAGILCASVAIANIIFGRR